MFRYILNILQGYIRHWNDHHNELVGALWARCEGLRAPLDGVAKSLVVTSSHVMFKILGPNRIAEATAPLSVRDLRQLNRLHYERLYSVLLQGFAAMMYELQPQLRATLHSIVDHLSGRPLNSNRYANASFQAANPKALAWSTADAFISACPLVRSAPLLHTSLATLILADANKLFEEIRLQVGAVS